MKLKKIAAAVSALVFGLCAVPLEPFIQIKATPHRAGGTDTQSDFSSDCIEMMPLG